MLVAAAQQTPTLAMESIPQAVGIEEPPRFAPVHTFLVTPG